MLLDFNNWEQKSVIMHVVSEMVSALFCYVKAALDLDYTVNLYDKEKNKVSDQITDVEKDHFKINDQLTHIEKYKNLNGYYECKFLFSKPAGAVTDQAETETRYMGVVLRF